LVRSKQTALSTYIQYHRSMERSQHLGHRHLVRTLERNRAFTVHIVLPLQAANNTKDYLQDQLE